MKVQTKCSDCVFAIADQFGQVGCEMGRLSIYEQQGVALNEMDDLFYTIHRACHAKRTESWAAGKPREALTALARKEILLNVDVLVLFDQGDSEEELRTTLRSVRRQELLPCQVVLVNNQKKLSRGEVYSLCVEELGGDESPLVWKVNTTLATRERPLEDSVDLNFKDFRGLYYLTVRAGANIPEGFLSSLDRAVNDNLERWALLYPESPATPKEDWVVVQKAVHRLLGGNHPATEENEKIILPDVRAKVQYLADTDNFPHLVKECQGWSIPA